MRWRFFFFVLIFSLFSEYKLVQSSIISPPVGCVQFHSFNLCSGKGRCIDIDNASVIIAEGNLPRSKCVCNSGWTGAGDLVDLSGHDCSQSVIYVRVMYSLTAAVGLFTMFLTLFKCLTSVLHLKHLIVEYEPKNTRKFNAGGVKVETGEVARNTTGPILTFRRCISELLEWEIIKLCCFSLPVGTFAMIVGLFRASKDGDEYVTGRAWGTTVCYSCVNWIGLTLLKRLILQWVTIRGKVARFTEQDLQRAEEGVRKIKNGLYLLNFFDLIIFIMYPLVAAFPNSANLLACLWYLIMAIELFILALIMAVNGPKLELIISDGIERLPEAAKRERQRALENIRVIQQFAKQMFLVVPSEILLALWPLARAKSTYLLVFGMIFQLIWHSALLLKCVFPTQLLRPECFVDSRATTHWAGHGDEDGDKDGEPHTRKKSELNGGLDVQNGQIRSRDESVELGQLKRANHIGNGQANKGEREPKESTGEMAERDRRQEGGVPESPTTYLPIPKTPEANLSDDFLPSPVATPSASPTNPNEPWGPETEVFFSDKVKQQQVDMVESRKTIFNPFKEV